jgi:hypothetical protein
MFLCDYILNQKRNPYTGMVEDVIINVSGNGHFELSNITSAWYIGCDDGAPSSRIIVIDREGNEFALPLRMESDEQHNALHNYFMASGTLRICQVRNLVDDFRVDDLYQLPLTGYHSEQSMIMSNLQG